MKPPLADIEAECAALRKILDAGPPHDGFDCLYGAYNALLFVLGYGVQHPSAMFDGPKWREAPPATDDELEVKK